MDLLLIIDGSCIDHSCHRISAKKEEEAAKLLDGRAHLMNSMTAQRMGIKERKVSIVAKTPSGSDESHEGWAVVCAAAPFSASIVVCG
jgi:hypothetical protein